MGPVELSHPPAPEARPTDLRRRAARGTVLNAGFQIGLSGLGLLQRLVAAAFLTRAEFGLWAVILTVLVNLAWLKDVGITDKYLQQSEADQELAFQKAFTLELYASLALLVLIGLTLPLWALAYGHQEVIVAGLVTALIFPLAAFQMPALIPYRRLDYRRNRLLTSVSPVVGFVVTVALAVAGIGYWCFVIGGLAGGVAGAVVCVATSPYRLRLRYDPGTARAYASFSWPLVASGLSGLILVQGSLLVINHNVGIGAVGVVGLVIGIVGFAERADTVVSQTLYPAICRVVDRRALLAEVFVKSNRVALMWAMPFAVGLALFAGDLVTHVLGERWRSAEGLLVTVGLCVGFGQVAFNWLMFLRALNWTRPIFVATGLNLIVFLAVLIPATAALGIAGYGLAFIAQTLLQIGVRAFYMRRLFGDFAVVGHTARSVAPVLPGVAVVLVARAAGVGGDTLAATTVQLTLYAATVAAATFVIERALVAEIAGLLRRVGGGGEAPVPASP